MIRTRTARDETSPINIAWLLTLFNVRFNFWLCMLCSMSVRIQWYQLWGIIVFLDHVRWVIDSMGLAIENHFKEMKKTLNKQEFMFIVQYSHWIDGGVLSYQRFKGSSKGWWKNNFVAAKFVKMHEVRWCWYRGEKPLEVLVLYLILKMKRPICLQNDWV